MINTVTLNPALDFFVEVGSLNIGETNRTSSSKIFAGGKGINVSTIAKNLGVKSSATGFLAGFTGEEISRLITEIGIDDNFVRSKGSTRINIKLKETEENSRETEINSDTLIIEKSHIDELMNKISNFNNGEFLVLSGNVPKSINPSIYSEIMKKFAYKNFVYVLDTSGDAFKLAIKERPFLIKPNIGELSEYFEVDIKDVDEAVIYCKKLQEQGARNILLSMGSDGALLLDEAQNIYKIKAPKGKLVASSGAGDSMVAGFLVGYIEGKSKGKSNKEIFEYALKLATASGSATAFSDGLASYTTIYDILKTL